MNESIKAVCALVLIVGTIAAAVAWTDNRPNDVTWYVRIGCPIAALASFVFLLRGMFRRDLQPDYLRQIAGTYFNRDGFCFAFDTTASAHVCIMQMYFQNQRDRRCTGRVALRPSRGFFLGRARLDAITFEVECEPAAFGVARLAIPVSENLQGKRQPFDVGASVVFPEGKGKTLRFHDGLFLGTNERFSHKFHTALMVAGAMTGQIVLSSPAKVTIAFPTDVVDYVPEKVEPEVETLWKLGDPPLETVA